MMLGIFDPMTEAVRDRIGVRRPWLAVAAAFWCLGCYSYVPSSLDVVPSGSEVRALLSTEGQTAILHGVGIDARSIVGTLEANDGAAVHFAVPAPFAMTRPGAPVEYVRFALPPRDILRLEVRRFDGLKTGVLIGALTGTAAAVALLAAGGVFEGGSPPPPGGQQPVR